ncbi:MAG: DUF427 domain-containing protein [Bacteroidales bacterium]
MKAIWNNKVLAESNDTEVIEGNHYFPPDSVNNEYFVKSDTKSVCPWKGTAHYYSLEADGKINKDAAWYYPYPRSEAKQIKDYVAFWKGVKVTE